MTVKTDISRFQIHDELTAPDDSARLLQGMASAGGSVSKFVGVLAGAPAALRAFARMRHELRGGALPRATRERIALAVAEERGDTYSVAQHAKTARAAGLGLDEISRPEAGAPPTRGRRPFLSSSRRCSRPRGARLTICSKRPARSIGATRSCSRPWPTWR